MAPAAATAGRPAAIAPSKTDQPKVDVRPDRVSAMVTARAQGSRVESEADRTPSTATFANPDGTWTTESYAGIVRSKSDADSWVPVDASVAKVARGFAPKAAPFDAGFSDGGDKSLGSITTPSGSTIDVGWPTKLPAPQVEGDQLTYPDAAGSGADLVVTSYADGFNYSMVLDQAPAADSAPVQFRVPLDFGDARIQVGDDGSIVVKDGKHQVATMTAPVMWDSTPTADGAGPDRVPVTASVEGTGSARTLVLRPDMDYLRDPARTFPVTVDPTVNLSVAGDTWIDSLLTNSQSTSPELQVGSNNLGLTKMRSFMYFDWTPLYTMPPGVLTSAQVQLSNFATGACAGTAVRMSRITGSWSEAGLTWGNQPAVTSTGSSTSTVSLGASGCTGEGVATFDATAIVNDWINGALNVGVRFTADNESAASGFRKYRSVENGDPAKAPKMVFTYNAYPSAPVGLTVSPGYNGYVSSTTPTLSAVVSDPDGGQVRGRFEVKSGATTVWTGTSPWTVSGSRVEVSVPSGILSDGPYSATAYSEDSALSSASTAKNFTVDTVAPAVTIGVSGFTNGGWTTTIPSSSTLTLTGSADTGGFYVSVDGISYGAIAANASGAFSNTFAPTAGWHTIEATPVDKAGNQGPKTTFNYGAGPAAFVTPNLWTESTASFPLELAGPPSATGATLTWQVYGEPTWHDATQLTAGGTTWTGSVSTVGGHSTTPSLLWKATAETLGTGTLTGPALVIVKGCFHYASAADSCTIGWPVILSDSARGGNYPEAQVGPASVALVSGEATISDTDAADSKAGLGRTFSAFGDATLTGGLFGPGWSDPSVLAAPSADAKAQVIDNRTKDGTFVIVDPDSDSQAFRLKPGSSTVYLPVHPTGDATQLTYTPAAGGDPDRLELSRPLGSGAVATTWTLKASDTGGDPEWTFLKVDTPTTSGEVAVTSTAQRPVWIRESDPAVSATCTATTQTVGCRGLKVTYTGTGAATRVASVDRVIGAATQGEVVTKTVATYSYDGTGKLTSVCSAVPAAGKPPLCVGYAYTTVNSRTLLSQITPPGLKPWRFSYDSIARLTTVKREKPTGGDATWSVDYTLTPTSAGLPDLSASTAAQWGQNVIPTKVFAVYEPFTGTADVTKADLYYTTATGTTTNTATYGPSGWLVDTSWYDAKGNQVQHLDSTGWARVQAAAAPDRPRVASDASSYTVYNTWGGTDVAGTRVVDQYGPAHTASLKNGTNGLFRTHTHTMYDDDPNVDPTLITATHGSAGLGLVVEATNSVTDPSMSTDYDSVVTKYGYEPVVPGDGNGWVLGASTSTSVQVNASTWSTSINRVDTSGRAIETRQPGGSADTSGAGNDAHATSTSYYTAVGTGDCGGKPEWSGLVCKVGPMGQPSGQTIPTTYYASYDANLEPTVVNEISGGVVTRTNTMTNDFLGRLVNASGATTGSGVVNETMTATYSYDDNTGLPTGITSGTTTVAKGYDSWGRQNSYVDAFGNTSSANYDGAGEVSTGSDGSSTYTYSYNSHGLLTSVDAGGGVGSFAFNYAPDGALATVTYPNGMVATYGYDEIGTQTALAYSQGTTRLLSFTAARLADGRARSTTSPASSQTYAFDGVARLTSVQDTRSGACTTRTYGFDASSGRTSLNTYAPAANGACQTSSPLTTKVHTYDSAGRISDSGYTYDTLGRTLTIPQTDTGLGASGTLAATYHANSMVASLTQPIANASGGTDNLSMAYGLDPTGRIDSITATDDGVETRRIRYRFANSADSPCGVDVSTDGGVTWTATRYVSVPGVGTAASTTGASTTLQLVNLHGDVVATIADLAGSTAIGSYSESQEFGTPSSPTGQPARYAWLGAYQRSTDSLGGLLLMGARLYNPTTGAFLTPDPIPGGNATAYGYPEDPVNEMDISGECKGTTAWDTFLTGVVSGSTSGWERWDAGYPVSWEWVKRVAFNQLTTAGIHIWKIKVSLWSFHADPTEHQVQGRFYFACRCKDGRKQYRYIMQYWTRERRKWTVKILSVVFFSVKTYRGSSITDWHIYDNDTYPNGIVKVEKWYG